MRPIGWVGSVLYFGIPAGLFSLSILGVLPWLVRRGVDPITTFNLTFGGPLALMLVAALVAYRLEGHPWTWAAFRDRMRLRRPTGRDWLWTIGLVAVAMAGGWAIQPVARLFADVALYRAPDEFTQFMSGVQQGFSPVPLEGRWDVLAGMVVALVVLNIGGEELWWRGIILPRQELAFGRWAWLANGVLWDLFHIFYHATLASIVGYLPSTVPLAFVAQRTRNTWPGVVAHLIGNIGFPIAIFFRVIGR